MFKRFQLVTYCGVLIAVVKQEVFNFVLLGSDGSIRYQLLFYKWCQYWLVVGVSTTWCQYWLVVGINTDWRLMSVSTDWWLVIDWCRYWLVISDWWLYWLVSVSTDWWFVSVSTDWGLVSLVSVLIGDWCQYWFVIGISTRPSEF